MNGYLKKLLWLCAWGLILVPFFDLALATTTVTSTQNVVVTVQIIGPQVCGNNYLEPPEECDDGNLVNGDGCSDACILEQICGDGVVQTPEECDDGNLVNGDGCSNVCVIEIPPTPTTTPAGWSGGKTLTTVDFFGLTSPYALVRLTKFGRVVATKQADSAGDFYIRLSALPAGSYDFGLFAEDRFDRKTLTSNFTISLVARTVTTIEHIFLTPTISINRSDILSGQKIMVFGETHPNSLVSVYVGDQLYDEIVYSDSQGFWQMEIDSKGLAIGSQSVKVKALSPSAEASNFSESLYFAVVPTPNPGLCSGPDLNIDGWVDIFDFSILLSFWQQRNPANICADINRDGIVDIVDFSIMLYWWSESLG
jgi:cysteine-rich repeat protein